MLRVTSDKTSLTINGNGKHGSNGRHGQAGVSSHSCSGYGGDGFDGADGKDGQDGQSISLRLSLNEMANDADVHITGSHHHTLALGNPNASINISAQGGDGGKGGDGGDGGDGGKGYDGHDATQFTRGTNGEHGGQGGRGGDGGDGGHAGNAGSVTIHVTPEDTDLLMLVNPPGLSGGSGGKAGRGGYGGSGGLGGAGGSSYRWTEEVHLYESDGDGNMRDCVHYHTRVSEGGENGRKGNDGSNGRAGANGHDGNAGHLHIKVGSENQYNGIYKLSLQSIYPIQSDDGIIEPGESLEVKGVTFKNVGLMPTPAYQQPVISLIRNPLISFSQDNALPLCADIAPSESATLADGLRFRVNQTGPIPAIDSTFRQTAQLQFNACMTRVNKSFENVNRQQHTIDIRYPVEISTVSLPPTISKGEEAPFVVALRNVSKKSIGVKAEDPRLLGIDFSLAEGVSGQLVSIHDSEGNFLQSLDSPYAQPHAYLPPGQVAYFVGTLQFNEDTPSYTQAKFRCRLNLGHLDRPLVSTQAIQQRHFQLQLADSYQFDPDADMVLVTNNETDRETIESWKAMAEKMGTSISVWNTSLYAGISYTQRRDDEGCFIEQMKDKVMVILNNEMTLGEEKTRSTDCLDAMEIVKAAKAANVGTYVVGDHFDIRKTMLPYQSLGQQDHKEVIKEKFLFWRRPNEGHLRKRAAEVGQRLQQQHPDQRYVPFYHFKAKEQASCFSLRPTWKLGTVEARETLGQTHSHVAFREVKDNQSMQAVEVDNYNVIKLLPFAKKLSYLEKATDKEQIEIIKKAILADLCQEVLVFAKYKWNGDYSRSKLTTVLTNLRTLSEYPFSHTTPLSDVLLRYENFVNRVPTTSDKYFFPFLCRRTRLKAVCNERVKRMLADYFPDDTFNEERKRLQTRWKQVSREDMFSQLTTPYAGRVVFDDQLYLSMPHAKAELSAYHEKQSRFIEGHHLFASSRVRKESIESYKPGCKFT